MSARGKPAIIRLRRASVIATLSLLAWTATVSAECAWVLWRWDLTGTSRKDEKETWTPSKAVYSQEQCQNREFYQNITYPKYRETLPIEQRVGRDRSWLCLALWGRSAPPHEVDGPSREGKLRLGALAAGSLASDER